jgi:chemotaxis protein histidine kinase CheA
LAEEDEEAKASIKRELHTVKGAARMLQLGQIAEIAHATEELVLAIPAEAARDLTRVVDRLAGMVDRVAAGDEPEPDTELLAELEARLREVELPAEAVRVLRDALAVTRVVVQVGVERVDQDVGHVREEVPLRVLELGIVERHGREPAEGREGLELRRLEGDRRIAMHGHQRAERSALSRNRRRGGGEDDAPLRARSLERPLYAGPPLAHHELRELVDAVAQGLA